MNLPKSRHLVRFTNINNYAFNIHKPMIMLVEYVVDPQVDVVLGKDWVAIFPKDAHLQSPITREHLDQMVTLEHVIQRPVNKGEGRYKLNFSLCGSKNLIFGQEYKFTYCSAEFEILGVSESFKIFDLNKEVESLQNDVSKWSLRGNPSYDQSPENKWDQNSGNGRGSDEIISLQGNNQGPVSPTLMNESIPFHVEYNNRSNQNDQGFNQVVPIAFPQPLLSPRCFSANNSCNNCSRVGSLLSSQSDLYQQVKNLAEEKFALIQRVNCLEKQIELGQAAYQKQSILLLQEREGRINLQRELEILKYFQEEYVPEPLLTPRVTGGKKQVGGAAQSHYMRMKAFVGHQEKKIRSLTDRLNKEEQQVQFLTQKLVELQAENICKVKIVEKEVDATPIKVFTGTINYNNNEGEETSDTN